MRKIILDSLPTKKYGDKNRIDWKNANGAIVEFVYDDLIGNIKILNAKPSDKIIEIEYNNIREKIDKSSFINCKIGRIIGKQNSRGIVQGISDIATTDSWMIGYFQGGLEEAKRYSSGSNKAIYPICPYCGRIKNKEIKIKDIKKMHGISCVCNDKMPYPEKVMYTLLEYLNIPFVYHYSDEWTCDRKQKFEYDFKILKNKLCDECLIEMQGAQHYLVHGFAYKGGRTLNEEKDNDLRKKNCAYLNGYDDNTYFQIDCLESNFEYIISNILHCKFTKNFILNNNDLEKVKRKTYSNLCKKVCLYYKERDYMTACEIAKIFNIGKWRAIKFLKIGSELGWCNYNPVEKIKKGRKKICKKIYVYDELGEYIGEFDGIVSFCKFYNDAKNIRLSRNNILQVLKHNRYSYKGLIFTYNKCYIHGKSECGTVKRMKCKICCFEKDGTLVNIYNSPADAERQIGISHSSICRCCYRKAKSAGGFVWRYYDDCDDIKNGYTYISNCGTKKKHSVIQFDKNGNYISMFNSITEAVKSLGVNTNGSSISACCRGKHKTAYGYIWKYADEFEEYINKIA